MGKKFISKILFLPIIVALLVTLSIISLDGDLNSEALPPSEVSELVMLCILFFSGFYFFIIVFVLPINIYISKKIRNKLSSFMLFNGIGGMLVGCIDIWLFTKVDFVSIYLIFPFFSILSLIPFFDYNSDDLS